MSTVCEAWLTPAFNGAGDSTGVLTVAAGAAAVASGVLTVAAGATAAASGALAVAAGAGAEAGAGVVASGVLTVAEGAAAAGVLPTAAHCSEIIFSSVTAKPLSAVPELSAPFALRPASLTSWPSCGLRSTLLVVILKI